MSLPKLHILVDADGTLYDWGYRWDEILNEKAPHLLNIPRAVDQRSFNLRLNLTPEEAAVVDEVFNHPGFYGELRTLPGSQEAIAKMIEQGHHVQIATSPWWDNPTCLQDKADSIERDFGIRKSIVFANDKTGLRGDVLFDDKPGITGHYEEPTWTQILYDQPYNRELQLPRITDWSQWEEVLEKALDTNYAMDVVSY